MKEFTSNLDEEQPVCEPAVCNSPPEQKVAVGVFRPAPNLVNRRQTGGADSSVAP